jgi:hypothetical protein
VFHEPFPELLLIFINAAWLFELAGGAIIDFENNCVPKSQREASFTIAALHQWEMTIDDDRCIDSAEEASSADPRLILRFNMLTLSSSVDRRIAQVRTKRRTIPQRTSLFSITP